jgi:hypothetical protein
MTRTSSGPQAWLLPLRVAAGHLEGIPGSHRKNLLSQEESAVNQAWLIFLQFGEACLVECW